MGQVKTRKPIFVQTLTKALAAKLKGAEIDIERIRKNYYRFIVTWARFDKMGHPERQRLVWELADAVLEKSDLLNVAMILTLGNKDLPK